MPAEADRDLNDRKNARTFEIHVPNSGGLSLSRTLRTRANITATNAAPIESKAPIFAFLIAVTGTLRGMQVKGSAEELGRLTTVAVVQSIFLIIVVDAICTVVYARIGF